MPLLFRSSKYLYSAPKFCKHLLIHHSALHYMSSSLSRTFHYPTILGDQYKLRSASVCNNLSRAHAPISSLARKNSLLNTVFVFKHSESEFFRHSEKQKATEQLTTGGHPAYIRTGHLQDTCLQRQPYHKRLVLRIPLAVKTSSHLWYLQQQQRLVDLFH